jgi:hypothetical protein
MQVFMLPFFFTFSFLVSTESDSNGQTLTLAMIASVVVNVSGLLTGGLYLFLKSTTSSTIGPKKNKAGDYERQRLKHTIRRYDTNGSNFSGSLSHSPSTSSRRGADDASSFDKEVETRFENRDRRVSWNKSEDRELNPLRANAVVITASTPRTPEPAQVSSISQGHARKRSYSLFPNGAPADKPAAATLPATTYTPHFNARAARGNESALDALKPPPAIRNFMGRHRRDSSMVSSATVQIGLRLSNVDDFTMPSSNRATAVDPEVMSIDFAKEPERPETRAGSPSSVESAAASEANSVATELRPARESIQEVAKPILPIVRALRTPSPPPVPYKEAEQDSRDSKDSGETLSPTVYSPQGSVQSSPQSPSIMKLPSPMGVGFTRPLPKFANGSPRTPERTTPPPRSNPSTPPAANTKADWI